MYSCVPKFDLYYPPPPPTKKEEITSPASKHVCIVLKIICKESVLDKPRVDNYKAFLLYYISSFIGYNFVSPSTIS